MIQVDIQPESFLFADEAVCQTYMYWRQMESPKGTQE